MAEPLLQLRDVRAGYGDAVVLDGISLDLRENGSLAVLGRNGVGKSTLFLTIMGYTNFRRGNIVWKGKDITRLAPHLRARLGIGWVAQEREIFPSLTVEENLTVAARPGRWTLEPMEGLAPIIVEEIAALIRKMIVESSTTVILAEQHAQLALSMTENVVVLERGTIVHSAKSADMLKDTAAIDRYIGLRVAAVGSAART